MLQMVAELNLEGTLTGTLEVSTEADFRIAGSVRVTPNGHADVDMNSPEITHKQGFAIGASATATARVSVGPVLTIWPVPGIPITFRPMVHAEAKAQGTLSYESGHGLLFIEESHHVSAAAGSNSSLNMTTTPLQMCGAAALNIYADVDITGFALPAIFKSRFNSRFLIDELTAAVLASAAAFVRTIAGPLSCIPGASTATNFIMEAAREAASQITGLIPNLNLDLGLPSIQLLSPKKLFCKEVYTTPGFDSAPCAAELGCKHAGRGPPPGEELPPPEQVTNHDTRASGGTITCPALVMGDRFIQLGNTWRLADIDGRHLVLQHSNGEVPIVWRNDGRTFWRPWHRNANRVAWDREAGPSKGIAFGFQFIQIGKFRIGANDDDHFSVVHSSHKCPQTWRGHDLSVHHGTGWNLYDRGEGFQTGVTFGDRFVQVGKMRFGAADDNHFNFYFTPTGKSLEIFRGHDGTRHPGNNGHWNHHNEMVARRLPAHWTCPDIAEKAHGECNPEFGHWGDRFIQLAKWRLAAIDANHFSISHEDGKTAQIYRNDGHLFPGPRTDFSAWHRPIGFPHGITFGPSFIQISNFRIAAMDHDHMSITHISGITAQVFRGHDGSLHPNVPHHWNAWSLRAGPASGVTFGDRFIQLGEFRIGGDDALYVTHRGHNKSPQIFRSDGLLVPGTQHHYAYKVNDRYAMWHCGGIQGILGTCPGITVGDGFLQLSDWRVAGIDSHHFSFSHRSIHTPPILTSDGHTHSGPRRDWHTWDREAGVTHSVKFGDRFIQFGHWWRLGEWEHNGRHLVLSHRNNKAPIIWRDDGTVHNGPHHGWSLFGRATGAPSGIAFGQGFVQIGKWRIGDVDGHHFSIAVNGKTAEIFTGGDARRHYGPRTDWTTFGRPISDCRVVPDTDAKVMTIKPPLTEGLECEYFYNHAQCSVPDLGSGLTPAHTQVLSNVYMHHGSFPHVRQTDNFCIRCSGFLTIRTQGSYRFHTASDDGSLLYLNGERIVDNNGCHGEQERSSHHMTMAEGSHNLVVEMCEMGGGENFKMRYEGPDTGNSKVAVSASVLKHELKFFEPGLECEYFYNQAQCHVPNLGALTPAHTEVVPNIDMHSGNFPHVRQTDNFCIRCSGYVSINQPGNYKFYTASDDGSLLFLNGERIVDNNGCHGEQERSSHHKSLLTGSHQLVVEMCEMGGAENLKVRYEGPDTGNSKVAVPASVLIHAK
ncbi:unnamed protein product [Symbiodinium sp. CCMP2592]|nr:unnamed protein product [Symbiodinium sp. CCMP2592]